MYSSCQNIGRETKYSVFTMFSIQTKIHCFCFWQLGQQQQQQQQQQQHIHLTFLWGVGTAQKNIKRSFDFALQLKRTSNKKERQTFVWSSFELHIFELHLQLKRTSNERQSNVLNVIVWSRRRFNKLINTKNTLQDHACTSARILKQRYGNAHKAIRI